MLPRLFFALLAASSFLLAWSQFVAAGQQTGAIDPWSSADSHVVGDSTRYLSIMKGDAKAAAVYLNDEHRLGLFLSSTGLPSAGRALIVDAATGTPSSCSGVVVATHYFLTAGHCVCPQAPSMVFCKAHLADLEIQVFLPTAGLFQTVGLANVNPDFRLPKPIGPGTRAMADLAIVRLARSPWVKPASIATLAESGKVILSSFGYFAFTDDNNISGRGFRPGVQYMDGVEQLSGRDHLITNPQGCGRSQTPDTFCTEPYAGSDFSTAEPSEQTSAICEGDSGGPLYQPVHGGFAVVGLVSYYYPQIDDCTGEAPRRTHAVDLNKYRVWISSNVGQATGSAVSDPICIDAIFGPGNFMLPEARNSSVVTLTSFTASFNASGEANRRPTPAVETSGTCVSAIRFGVISCDVPATGSISIKIPTGMAQVTLCVPNTETMGP